MDDQDKTGRQITSLFAGMTTIMEKVDTNAEEFAAANTRLADLVANLMKTIEEDRALHDQLLVQVNLHTAAFTDVHTRLAALDTRGYSPVAPSRTLKGTWRGGGTSSGRQVEWVSTGRKVTLTDGTVRTLYKNASKPGEQRIRRMTQRDGRSVATYVKPPK